MKNLSLFTQDLRKRISFPIKFSKSMMYLDLYFDKSSIRSKEMTKWIKKSTRFNEKNPLISVSKIKFCKFKLRNHVFH